jgi:hypothetical protein
LCGQFGNVGKAKNQRSHIHQNTRTAEASMLGRTILCRLSRVIDVGLLAENVGGRVFEGFRRLSPPPN